MTGGQAAGVAGQAAGAAGPAAGVAGAGAQPPAGAASGPGRQPWRAAFFALMAIALVAGVGWALLESRFFVVRDVQVTGTHLVSPAEVRSAADIPAGLPLIRVNSATVAHRVERLRQVQSAQVSRDWPNRILVSVTERVPALAVPGSAGYDLIDKYGVVVETVSQQPLDMPILDLPGGSAQPSALRGNPAVYAAAVVVRELPRYLARELVSVQAPSSTEVTLRLGDGVSIVWGGTDRPAEKAKELGILMRTHARSYDVSAPGTAVTSG
jgi:cell division protein FtsQ